MAISRYEMLSRKLSAIVYADVHGYSRLMDQDEAGTVVRLTRSLNLIRGLTGDYGGSIVDTAGDGLVALFPSPTQALHFAVEMQRELSNEAVWSGADDPITYRIGITVGDTIASDGTIYGHGINLAARIQSLAAPRGICIAESVRQFVRDDPECSFRSLGKQKLKNIAEEIEVFAVDFELSHSESATPPLLFAPAPERFVPESSLAVLPLENVSGDPADFHLCQGVVADLISNLCRFRNLMVIARHSTIAVVAQTQSLREIANQLGVRYLLSGSLRRAGNRLRVAMDLIEAQTEHTIWSERYDGSIEDVFAFQDDVTATTASRLAIQIDMAEKRRLMAHNHPNIHAYGMILRGQDLSFRFRPESNWHARRLYEQARNLDPRYARSYAALSRTFNVEWRYAWTKDPEAALNEALNLANLAVQYDDLDARGYSEMGLAHLYKKQHDPAIAAYERALQLNPNDADLLAEMGDCLVYVRQAERSVKLLERAMRLNPYYPDAYLWYLGDAYFQLGEYEKTIETLQKMRDGSEGHRLMAASHAYLGNTREAEMHAHALLEVHPNFTTEQWRKVPPHKYPEDTELLVDGLRKAGLK
ncbi:MAG: tetratricopeptide repeat protein [Mesorhizobium sp.]|uniref:tetratricopeptide repeat protein n=1 Tax=Mesorhizobium sp. TaxID=1871066 RepID=UPI0011F41B24|nr:tetratricopeptide repeat protein [Mesorhizobium sp.]TIQ33177.1 MAG: tetratricopeptide repeat protein [Mesorhizobium sp.]